MNRKCVVFLAFVVFMALGISQSENLANAGDLPSIPEDIPHLPAATPIPIVPPLPVDPPTPSDPPKECSYIDGSLIPLGTDHTRVGTLSVTSNEGVDSSKLACANNLIEKVKSGCQSSSYDALKRNNWKDECWAYVLGDIIGVDWNGKNHKIGESANGVTCYSHVDQKNNGVPTYCPPQFGKHAMGCNRCGHATFAMSADDCSIIKVKDDMTSCGKYLQTVYFGCPVSLVWNKDTELVKSRSVVKFPLNQNRDEWTVWKGSSAWPLLVYDPEHKGEIRSAEQLFGYWTFGGQAVASLIESATMSDASQVQPRPWRNGYEALATLDADFNGKVDGDELEPLALWFDNNQDAISQPGEVKSLRELGITALFFEPDRKEANGDIYVSRGFERVVDGQTVVGESVDWISETSPRPFDLVNNLTGKSLEEMSFTQEASEKISAEGKPAEGAEQESSRFSGLWKWQIEDSAPQNGGYLMFAKNPNGGVMGYSLVERLFAVPPQAGVKSSGSVFAIGGVEKLTSGGAPLLSFSLQGAGVTVRSEASLSEDGLRLQGHSTVSGVEAGKPIKLSYKWSAVKQQ